MDKQPLRPLVKWVGGKTKLAPKILERLPAKITGTYFEPFVGGAAVFCALFNEGRLSGASVFCDSNRDLIALYAAVRDDVETLIAQLRFLEASYNAGDAAATEALYYRVRDAWNGGQRLPAHFVFLKQTAFNGLWRVSKDGRHNAAWGKYGHSDDAPPRILDEENLRAWSAALKNVVLFSGSALDWRMPKPMKGDAVYFDPPYAGTFDGYTEDGFGLAEHAKLLGLCARWHDTGADVVYSNSMDILGLLQLAWPRAKWGEVSTSYTINRDADGRSGKREVLAWTT